MAGPHDLQVMSPTQSALENFEGRNFDRFGSSTHPPTPPKHITDPEQRLSWLLEFERQKEESERLSLSFESAASCPQLQNSLTSPSPPEPTLPSRAENDFFGLRSNGNDTADRYPLFVSGSAVPNDLFGQRSKPEETLSVRGLPDGREGNCGGANPHYLIGEAGGDSARENMFNFVENVQHQAGGDSAPTDSRIFFLRPQ